MRATPLFERDEALAVLGGALDRACEDRGALVAIEGEPGTGKSRLLGEALQLAGEREMTVYAARASELERGSPLGLIRRLLERPLAELSDAERERVVAGTARSAGELLRGAPPAEPPPRDALYSLVNGLYWILSRLAERNPVIVAVDDLHWGDGPSIHALAFLAGRLEDLPLALVLTARTGESLAGPDPRAELGESEAIGLVTRPLSAAATARLLEALLGSIAPEFAAAAQRATGGNPFLLRELALTVARSGFEPDAEGAERIAGVVPDAVRRWALQRLARLPDAAAALARSLAVLEHAELRTASAHAGLESDAARAAADELAAAGLVERALPLRFAHPLVRAAIYEQIPPGSREQAHHIAAELLAVRQAQPDAIAAHLFQCEPRGEAWAIASLRAAAAEALARGAADEAVRALVRAVQEGPNPELLAELGRARAAANDPAAVDDFAAAAAAAPAATRAPILAGLAQARYLAGDIQGAFDAAGAALAEITPGEGGVAEAEVLIGYLMAGRQAPELLVRVREELARPRLGPGPEPALAEVVRRQVVALDAFLRGDRAAALAGAHWVSARLARPAQAGELPSLLAIGPAFLLSGLGEWIEAGTLIEAGLERASRRGSRLETAEFLHERVWLRWRRGDVVGGLADAETIHALTEGAWDPSKVALRVAQAHLLLERDEADAARARVALPSELERQVPGTWGWPWLAQGRAVIAAAAGDWGAALAGALAAGERLAEIDATSPEYVPWRSLAARAAARLGDPERGLELASEELALAERIGAPRAIGNALAARAAIVGGAAAIEMLRAAITALAEAGARLERGRALLALGMELRRARQPRAAREPLRAALDLGHRIGSLAIAERALAELRAAGSRPRRPRSSGFDALTPREHEIAELAAGGLSNAEIAERLFISRKTVEGHLRAIFRKLDVGARGELGKVIAAGT